MTAEEPFADVEETAGQVQHWLTKTELHRVNRALRTITNCFQALVHATDESELLNQICHVIVNDGGYRLAWIGMEDEAGEGQVVARAGIDDGYVEAMAAMWTKRDSRLSDARRAALLRKERILIRDFATEPSVEAWRHQTLARGLRSSLVVPVTHGDQPICAIVIYAAEPDAFDEAEMTLLEAMASDLAYGIEVLRTRRRHAQAERDLRESRGRLMLAMEMARLAPWEYDVPTGHFVFNEHFYGLLRTSVEAEGSPRMAAEDYFRRFLPTEAAVAVQSEFERAVGTSDPAHTARLEHRVLRADGSNATLLMRFAIAKDGAGRTVRAFGVYQDVTERRQADEALRISEERFRTAMSGSPIGMALAAPDGRFTEVNAALCAIVGYSREELLRTRMQALTHPADVDQDQRGVQRLIDREADAVEVEKRYLHRDGHLVWTQTNMSLVRDDAGRPRYLVQQVQDITERKRAEAEMASLNERYARHEGALATLTHIHIQSPAHFPDVLRSVTEVVGRTLEVARVGVWRPGAAPSTFVCQDVYEWPADRHGTDAAMTGDVVDAYALILADADLVAAADAATDPRTSDYARVHLGPHGVTSILDVPIRALGGMVGVLSCGHVGPPRRWTPDELSFVAAVANLLSSLFAQVERQHLEEQLRQAQKLEGIGQLAGGVAHDFNNVLTVILGKAGQLALDPRIPRDLQEAAAEITHSGERAANLTRQLLAFSRRQAIQVKDVDLNAVIRNVSRMLGRILGEDLALHVRYADGPVLVRADAGMIDQVVMNLAVNARDAMRGGGELVVETSVVGAGTRDAERLGHRVGPHACLRVSDTGSGIAAEHLPHIFEPFFTTKDVGKGTGLGLATTYGIVQQHDGWIDVETVLGRGTTFRVFLPLLTGAAAHGPARRPADPLAAGPVRGRETILVVEDEEAVRSLIVEALRGFGYRVLEAPTGPRALDVWRAHTGRIDLLVTDMVMPDGMNGLELASELRRHAPDLRIIYISGYLAEVSQSDLLRSAGAAYLAKPFGLPALAALIRETLDATVSPDAH